jgi:methylase of polypeptide subunit release factors
MLLSNGTAKKWENHARGQVPTPSSIADFMVQKLFAKRRPSASDTLVDAGCGEGAFIDSVLAYCERRKVTPPHIIGIESDERLTRRARAKFADLAFVEIRMKDYLEGKVPADFIIGNPPYVSITELGKHEKARYRTAFKTAVQRFDLYLLFFEKSIENLKPEGRLCFITPEKFEYVHTAAPLRDLLTELTVEELYHVDEETFPGLVTYPTITLVEKRAMKLEETTVVRDRDGRIRLVRLPRDGSAWSSIIHGENQVPTSGLTLEDVCVRISAGVATGADSVFVLPKKKVPKILRKWTRPTVSGTQLNLTRDTPRVETRDVFLVPYDDQGVLLPESKLGRLRDYLARNKSKLEKRTCVTRGKRKWYAYHENLPLQEINRPKILCKDITREPMFWMDSSGDIIPRHSVYYIVPKSNVRLSILLQYLNSEEASSWMRLHCQHAANGFLRLQSEIIRHLPLPKEIAKRFVVDKQANLAQFIISEPSRDNKGRLSFN